MWLSKLIQGVSLATGPDLPAVIARAWEIHRHREMKGSQVSRSSLLYATYLVDKRVARALTRAGLVRAKWAKGLRVSDLDAPPLTKMVEKKRKKRRARKKKDVHVHKTFVGRGFEMYVSHVKSRPVDAVALAWIIVAAADQSPCGARLVKAGMDLKTATRNLSRAMGVPESPTPRPGTKKQAQRDDQAEQRDQVEHQSDQAETQGEQAEQGEEREEVRSEHWPASRLDSFEFSVAVQNSVKWAANVGTRRREGASLTTGLLFISLLKGPPGQRSDNAIAFLRGALADGDQQRGEEGIESYYETYEKRAPIRGGEESDWSIPWLSDGVVQLFERAVPIAFATTGSRRVRARHLVGAMLATAWRPPDGMPRMISLIAQFGIEIEVLIDHFLVWLQDGGERSQHPDDMDAWSRALGAGSEDRQLLMPRFHGERLEGPDRLEISPDVNAFAMLMASKDLAPPLSIGIFGDWGSGKSFFMAKLRDRITWLAARSAGREKSEEATAFHSDIVQIEFNAWHYVETNLWASLVTHIFESLHKHFTEDKKQPKEWELLLTKLDSATRQHEDVKENLREAKDELGKAQESHETAKVGLFDALNVFWTALKSADSPAKKQVDELEKVLGFDELQKVQEGLILRKQEAEQLIAQIPVFRRSVISGLGSLWSLGAGAVGAAVLVALVLGVAALLPEDVLKEASGGLSQVLGTIGAISGWLGTTMRKTSSTMNAFQATQTAVLKELRDTTKSKDLRKAEHEVLLAKDEVKQRREKVAALRVELDRVLPSRQLANFLKDRAASTDYRKYLGLPALIRRDFGQLHKLMKPLRFKVEGAEVASSLDRGEVPPEIYAAAKRVQATLPKASKKVTVEKMKTRWRIHDELTERVVDVRAEGGKFVCEVRSAKLPNIDRIVLYIDDLDRCPPKRVVDVLQAVHLLLAFPLFIVVVGVDARWLERSLKRRYQDQWRQVDQDGSSKDGDAADGYVAAPQDYLEKIFQVPFWLHPMTTRTTQTYLETLVRTKARQATDEESDESEEQRLDDEHHDDKRVDGTDQGEDVSEDKGQVKETEGDEEVMEEEEEGPEEGEETLEKEEEDEEEEAGLEEGEEEEDTVEDPGDEIMQPAQLELDPKERDFMQRLAPIIRRSPRATNRFVNVYRIFRAGIQPDELHVFLGNADEAAPYQAVQFLLAVIVGTPTIVRDVFEHIRKRGTILATLIDSSRRKKKLAPEAKLEWDKLHDFSKDNPEQTRSRELRELLKRYVDDVGRYSFRVGRS